MRLGSAIGLFLTAVPVSAQEFAGLDIGQPFANTQRLGLPISRDTLHGYNVAKWARPNGLHLSVTGVPGGPIVYMESDPLPFAPITTGPGLRFKVTTMSGAIDMLGGPGFFFTGRGDMISIGDADIWFHSYALYDRPQVIVTFAFAAPVTARRYEPDGRLSANDNALLEAVIVADFSYQAMIWGGEAIARPGYQPINLNYQ